MSDSCTNAGVDYFLTHQKCFEFSYTSMATAQTVAINATKPVRINEERMMNL